MKKLITTMVIIMIASGFLALGNTRAEAMHNESAVALTAGMFLLGIPVIHAMAWEAAHHEHAYGHACPPRYIERTKVVYVEPRHKKMHRHRDHDWDSRYGWDRDNDRRRKGDSRKDSGRHNDNGRRR